jgi:hypothetical protein
VVLALKDWVVDKVGTIALVDKEGKLKIIQIVKVLKINLVRVISQALISLMIKPVKDMEMIQRWITVKL